MKLLLKKIQESFESVNKLLSDLDDTHRELSYVQYDSFDRESTMEEDFIIERLQEERIGLRYNVEHELFSIRTRLISILEVKEMTSLIEIVNEIYKSEEIKSIEHYSYADIFTSPKLYKFQLLVEVINDLNNKLNINLEEYKIIELERLLRNTGYILNNSNIVPTSENDIQKVMYTFISATYPSTVRESSLPKPTKNYKPDFAIKNLATCIEFKYVTTKKEARKILGGIYEDIHAYSGYKDWTNFIAVIYMTKPFFTEDQMEEEQKMSEIPGNWKFILVHGEGIRKKNTQNNAPPPTGPDFYRS